MAVYVAGWDFTWQLGGEGVGGEGWGGEGGVGREASFFSFCVPKILYKSNTKGTNFWILV